MIQPKPLNINKNYYLIVHNQFFTKGFKRSVAINPIRETYCFIPNELYEFITKHNGKKISTILTKVNQEVLNAYIQFLAKFELGFLSFSKIKVKKTLSIQKDISLINNSIIELSENNHFLVKKTLLLLNECGTTTIEIRMIHFDACKEILIHLLNLKLSRIHNIELVISNGRFSNELKTLINNYSKITKLVLLNQEESEIFKSLNKKCDIYLIKNKSKDLKLNCGCVSPFYFSSNGKHYKESQTINTCLNKKVSIDNDGNIKNCPSRCNGHLWCFFIDVYFKWTFVEVFILVFL